MVDNHPVFQAEANAYVEQLQRAVKLNQKKRVLDFGCGFGLVSSSLAPRVGELFLWDQSGNMRRTALANVAAHSNVRMLDLSDPDALPDTLRFDLILVNSVAQYMTKDDFGLWLKRWKRMLTRRGTIVVSDLIPADYRSSLDMQALLAFSWRHGFLLRALRDGFREFRRYWKTRNVKALRQVRLEELRDQASEAGLSVEVHDKNLTYRARRITALLSHGFMFATDAFAEFITVFSEVMTPVLLTLQQV
jgi:cyclopropane fatty-acyl-phospholipid synthase-like methyltransferase